MYFPQLAAWHELVILGDVAAARKSCVLVMYNQAGGAQVARWNFENAWPTNNMGVASGGALRTEGIVLLYETIRVEKPLHVFVQWSVDTRRR